MTETPFWRKLRKKMSAAGWLCEKISGGRFKKGFPDCVLVKDGDVVFAELKVHYRKPTALQKKKIKDLSIRGANVAVFRLHAGQFTIEDEEGAEITSWLYDKIIKIWEEK